VVVRDVKYADGSGSWSTSISSQRSGARATIRSSIRSRRASEKRFI
jgi:hypothetical protein